MRFAFFRLSRQDLAGLRDAPKLGDIYSYLRSALKFEG